MTGRKFHLWHGYDHVGLMAEDYRGVFDSLEIAMERISWFDNSDMQSAMIMQENDQGRLVIAAEGKISSGIKNGTSYQDVTWHRPEKPASLHSPRTNELEQLADLQTTACAIVPDPNTFGLPGEPVFSYASPANPKSSYSYSDVGIPLIVLSGLSEVDAARKLHQEMWRRWSGEVPREWLAFALLRDLDGRDALKAWSKSASVWRGAWGIPQDVPCPWEN